MSVDLSAQQEPTISVITTVPVAQNGGEMDALLLGRIGVSTELKRNIENIPTTNTQRKRYTANTKYQNKILTTKQNQSKLQLSSKVRDA